MFGFICSHTPVFKKHFFNWYLLFQLGKNKNICWSQITQSLINRKKNERSTKMHMCVGIKCYTLWCHTILLLNNSLNGLLLDMMILYYCKIYLLKNSKKCLDYCTFINWWYFFRTQTSAFDQQMSFIQNEHSKMSAEMEARESELLQRVKV